MGRHSAPRNSGDPSDTRASWQGKTSLLANNTTRTTDGARTSHRTATSVSSTSRQSSQRTSQQSSKRASQRPVNRANKRQDTLRSTNQDKRKTETSKAPKTTKPKVSKASKAKAKKKVPLKERSPKSIVGSIFKWIGIILLALIVACFIFFVLMYLFVKVPAPGDIPTAQRVTLVASDGKTVLGDIIPEAGNRREVDAKQIPDHLRHATMAAEDREFMTNKGFSFTGFGRAAVGQVTHRSDNGGGSTITQQYVKNALVGNQHSYWRKFKELVASMKMSNQWSKDEIMTAYLNTIYFGRGAYGVETASQAYFNKHVQDLTPAESAMLAGLIQQPSNLDPRVNPVASKTRWKYVVRGMLNEGWLSASEVATMDFPKTIPENKSLRIDERLSGPNGLIKAQIMRELAEHGFTEQDVTSQGLRIVTTISMDAQNAAIEAVTQTLQNQPKQMRAAAVTIDPQTGGVLAYYGGARAGDFDYAYAPQMTGSSFKVFTLAAALNQDIPLSKMYSSAPYQMGKVVIENSEDMSCGTCTIASATVMSLNTSYYRLMMDLKNGSRDVQAMAYKAGIPREIPGYGKTLQNEDGTVEGGITLGAYPVRPFDMASAYATFAARGIYHEPFFVKEAVANGGSGRSVYKHDDNSGERRVKEVVADNVTSALEPIASYSNGHGLAGGRPSASKTGTVQLGSTGKNRDAWMVGYTPQASTAVWVGTQNGTALETSGGAAVWGSTLPSDIWQYTMNGALQNQQFTYFPTPGAIAGQAGRPESYYGGDTTTTDTSTKKESKSSSKHKPKKDHSGKENHPKTQSRSPLLPDIPGMRNPFGPSRSTPKSPESDNRDNGVLWR